MTAYDMRISDWSSDVCSSDLRGHASDLLDLHAALAPCVVGYGVIGARLAADPATRRGAGNPYDAWIATYSGEEYADVVRNAVAQLDRLAARRGGDADRKSTRLNSVTNAHLVCRLLLDKK